MTRTSRRFLFIIFLLLFAVATPAVLLSTAGYRVNWKKRRLEKTGVLQVTSIPEDATVVMSGRPSDDTTPATFTRLLPEDYDIVVRKDGYLPWKGAVTVRSGETTVLTDVTLFKDALPRLVLRADVVAGGWNGDADTLAAFVATDGGIALVAASENGLPEDVVSLPTLARLNEETFSRFEIIWSPDGSRALAFAASETEFRLWLVDAGIDSATATDIGAALPGRATIAQGGIVRVGWSDDGAHAIVVSPRLIDIVDADSLAVSHTVSPSGKDFSFLDAAMSAGSLFAIEDRQPFGAVVEWSADGASKKVAVTLGDQASRVALATRTHVILADGADGAVMFRRSDWAKIGAPRYPADHAATERRDGTGMLLAWNDSQAGIIDPLTGDYRLLTRVSSGIKTAFFLPGGGHAAIIGPRDVQAIPLADHAPAVALAQMESILSATVDQGGRGIAFVGALGKQRGFFRREL